MFSHCIRLNNSALCKTHAVSNVSRQRIYSTHSLDAFRFVLSLLKIELNAQTTKHD